MTTHSLPFSVLQLCHHVRTRALYLARVLMLTPRDIARASLLIRSSGCRLVQAARPNTQVGPRLFSFLQLDLGALYRARPLEQFLIFPLPSFFPVCERPVPLEVQGVGTQDAP